MDIYGKKNLYPGTKDQVAFLKTHTDTNGECTLVEVELADGGGVGLHYHKTYCEKFDCLEGEVEVRLNKTIISCSPDNQPLQTQTRIIYSGTGAAGPVSSW